MKIIKMGFLFFAISFAVNADELLTISSKDKGNSAFNYSVIEKVRNDNSSVLTIPNFQKRSAAASRWMMCAYTEIAQKRGFKFWAALYDDHSGDEIIVVFPSSQSLDDPAFNEVNVGSFNPKIMPVQVFKKSCGLSDV
jgi:hypothetical protein